MTYYTLKYILAFLCIYIHIMYKDVCGMYFKCKYYAMEMTYFSYFFVENVHISKVENGKVSRFKLKFIFTCCHWVMMCFTSNYNKGAKCML